MIKFLLIFALMCVVVDLFVRFIVDPMIRSSHKKPKSAESKALKFDPTLRLASETMYDGGTPHNELGTEAPQKNDKSIINNSTE